MINCLHFVCTELSVAHCFASFQTQHMQRTEANINRYCILPYIFAAALFYPQAELRYQTRPTPPFVPNRNHDLFCLNLNHKCHLIFNQNKIWICWIYLKNHRNRNSYLSFTKALTWICPLISTFFVTYVWNNIPVDVDLHIILNCYLIFNRTKPQVYSLS
jgi:hypothetical protein